MVELTQKLGVTHHVTATLRPGLSQALLEDRLHEWVIRVNRTYLGRNWFKESQIDLRMKGLVFFEYGRGGDNPHSHLLLRPPAPAEALHFEAHAPFVFAGFPTSAIRGVAPGGTLHVQQIGPEEKDLLRVVGYDTKEMEFRSQAYEDWKYIDDLSRISA